MALWQKPLALWHMDVDVSMEMFHMQRCKEDPRPLQVSLLWSGRLKLSHSSNGSESPTLVFFTAIQNGACGVTIIETCKRYAESRLA